MKRHISIKSKLLLLMMIVSSVVILLCVSVFTMGSVYTLNKESQKELELNAQLLGSRSAAALAFNNPQFSKESLTILSEKENISYACVYDKEGKLFAFYPQDKALCQTIDKRWNGLFKDSVEADWNTQRVAKTIFSNGEVIGAILLVSNQNKLHAYIYNQLIMGIIIVFFACIGAYFLASYLQRFITGPIIEIVKATEKLSLNPTAGNFAVPKYAEAELTQLSNALNVIVTEMFTLYKNKNYEIFKYNKALSANHQALKFLHNSIDRPCEAAHAVSELFLAKPMGDDLESYAPYVDDIRYALSDYKFVLNSTLSLAKEYEHSIQQPRIPTNIFEIINEKIGTLRQENSELNCDIQIDGQIVQQKNIVFSLYVHAWKRLNNLILQILPTVLENDTHKMFLQINYHEDQDFGYLAFDVQPYDSQEQVEPCKNIDELIEQIKLHNKAEEGSFYGKLLTHSDFIFLIDSAKYIANANDIIVEKIINYPYFVIVYKLPLGWKISDKDNTNSNLVHIV